MDEIDGWVKYIETVWNKIKTGEYKLKPKPVVEEIEPIYQIRGLMGDYDNGFLERMPDES